MASVPFNPHPVSVECIVFAFDDTELHVLTCLQDHKAYKEKPALPSGSLKESDDPEKSVKKTLSQFPNLKINAIAGGGFAAAAERFPKNRVIGLSMLALAHPKSLSAQMPKSVQWVKASKPGNLALDHKDQVQSALDHLREKSIFHPVLFDLLPEKFTLTQLQALYENIHGKELDKRNFRKKVLALKVLSPSKEYEKDVSHKAARFYIADRKKFKSYTAGGGLFIF